MRNQNYSLSALHLFTYWIIVSIIAEWILPLLTHKLYFDYWDILMYAIGTLAFKLAQISDRKPD